MGQTKQPVKANWPDFEKAKPTVLQHLCNGMFTKEIALEINQPYRRVRYMIDLLIIEHKAKCLHHLTAIAIKKKIVEIIVSDSDSESQ